MKLRVGGPLLLFLYLTLVWGALLTVQGRPLGRLDADGIVAIECAPEEDSAIFASRSASEAPTCAGALAGLRASGCPSARQYVAAASACDLSGVLSQQLRLDYVFIVLYVATLALGALWAGARISRRHHRTGVVSGALGVLAALAAGLFDALENRLLLGLIAHTDAPWNPGPCQAKWILVAAVVALMAISLPVRPAGPEKG